MAGGSRVEPGETFEVRLTVRGAGRLQALSASVTWDSVRVALVDVRAGAWWRELGGILLSGRPGVLDLALLGARTRGASGEGDLAVLRFRSPRQSDPGIGMGRVLAGDVGNRPLPAGLLDVQTIVGPPTATLLLAPAPNPSRGPIDLTFTLAHAGPAEVVILDVAGRQLRTLSSGDRTPGAYHFVWDGRDDRQRRLGAGISFARLRADGRALARKLVILP